MPVVTQKSILAQKLGARLKAAHEEIKGNKFDPGFTGELPAGIDGGVARLTSMKFGEYGKGDYKGELFFMASGSVVSPETHEGKRTKGKFTKFGPEPLCDTPGRKLETLALHLNEVYDVVRSFGVNTDEMPEDGLMAICDELVRQGPYFEFRTFSFPKRKPDDPEYNQQYDGPDAPAPRVHHKWLGVVEGYAENTDPGAGVVNNTVAAPAAPPPTAPKANGKPTPSAPSASPPARAAVAAPTRATAQPAKPPVGRPTPKPAAPQPPPTEPAPYEGGYTDQGDIDELLALANQQDGDAQTRLNEMAVAAGFTNEEVEATTSYEEVVQMIRGEYGTAPVGTEGSGGAVDDGTAWQPYVNESYKYTVLDKTGKPVLGPDKKKPRKPVECKVLEVGVNTVKLQSLDDPTGKTVFANVPWDKLEAV